MLTPKGMTTPKSMINLLNTITVHGKTLLMKPIKMG